MSTVMTPAFLSSIRAHPHLPPNTWYYIAATTLSVLNMPDEVPKVYEHALRSEAGSGSGSGLEKTLVDAEQLSISRRTREALIKASAVGGLPKTINSLISLKAVTPAHLLDEPPSPSPTARHDDLHRESPTHVLRRGEAYWDQIYGKVSRRVMGQMERSGTEDLALTARLMYGHLLSNTSILSAAETSFVLIAGLIPQDVNPQLKGHLKGALNAGASAEEVRAVRAVAIQVCEACGMRKLDEQSVSGWGWRSEIANV